MELAEILSAIVKWGGTGIGVGVVFIILVIFAKQFLYVCRPNEVLIFSGSKHRRADGAEVGYRIVAGGRAWRVPLLETVQRMDMRTMPVEIEVHNAYSKVGIPLSIRAVANVKVSSEQTDILNAIERFLGKPTGEIRQVTKETMEGNLRGVLATLTPEEVNEDRLKFAQSLAEEAGHDLKKLGLMLDTLKIQAVTDEVEYLDSIGRKGIAEVIRDAEIVESNCSNEANKIAADAEMRARVAHADAEREIVQARNDLRRVKADLEAAARAEELRAEAAAEQARAEAEHELQTVRQDLEKLRLEAEVIVPADIERQAAELIAAGEAAPIIQDGAAIARSAHLLSEAWAAAGDDARDIYVLSQLDEIAAEIATACRRVTVEHVHLIDDGSGTALPRYAASYPAMVSQVLREVALTSGVDVLETVMPRQWSEEEADHAGEEA